MDVLYFLRLLRPTTTHLKSQNKVECVNARLNNGEAYDDSEEEEEEDSFFELELTVPPDFDYPRSINGDRCKSPNKLADRAEPKVQQHQSPPATEPLFSKRKILPIEPVSSPKPHQSPISVLKQGPKFRVLAFRKSKSMPVQKTGEKQEKGLNQEEKQRFVTVKVKLDEMGGGSYNNGRSKLARNNSLRKQILDDTSSENSSRRFPKEIVQKYLKLINPLYIKVAKKECDRMKFSGELLSPFTTPSASPAATAPVSSPKKEKHGSFPAGIREVCKHLRKSKSASSGTGVSPPATLQRRDDSLLLQNDGIQSAILHCKRSFNSSRDSSSLSRFSSDRSMDSPRVSSDEF
ncbi:unnamed protein product [Linum tenue]|uniref:Membrane-associated kinase regulator 5 n=1 Tax=Linum tenue TaxID=586396 RepID=A0AAV0J1U7_9ROSI|nr:unnamed protein product [Linum tenue]